jgi:hypothetical protein
MNDQDRTGRGAAQHHRNDPATPTPPGGAGGRSGTGQATPHHGIQPAHGEAALNPPADPDAPPPVPGNGASYQSGGTRQDRPQKDEERKVDEGTAPSRSNAGGGADPAPGKQES